MRGLAWYYWKLVLVDKIATPPELDRDWSIRQILQTNAGLYAVEQAQAQRD